jgi:hypothetical protein
MTDKKVDLNAPVTKEEIAERLSKLTPEQLAEARQQRDFESEIGGQS